MKLIPTIYFGILMLLVASLTFSYKINSICIIALFLVWLVDAGFAYKFKVLSQEPFFILNALLFCFYLLGVYWSEDKGTARFFVEKNLSLVVLPMVLLSMNRLTKEQFFFLGKIFVAGTIGLMTVATGQAIISWLGTFDIDVFFYHKLVERVGLSAIVASLLCIFSMVILLALPGFSKWKWLGLICLSSWLVLLSSKLFLVVLGLIIVVNLSGYFSLKGKSIAVIVIFIFLLLITFVPNPVRKRFEDINKFRLSYLSARSYNRSIYFDGLSMRLVFIKFGWEILKENGNYLMGVGTGDAENLLKGKIRAYNMYQGDGVIDKEGYLQYGFHNQFLQKLLQLGLIGFALFLAVLVYCFTIAVRYKNRFLFNLMLLFSLSFFSDTLLEHQVGLVLFLSFICFAINLIREQEASEKKQCTAS